MRKSFATAVGVGAMFLASIVAAGAQDAQTTTTRTTTTKTMSGDVLGVHNPYCGAWVNGTFQENGNCVTETTTTTVTSKPAEAMAPTTGTMAATAPRRFPERISGKIIAVDGHMVTLQHGAQTLIVNDSRALNNEATGHVATGRDVVAHGYWEGDTFYANRFD